MADPLLLFDGVEARALNGRVVFAFLDWTVPRGARLRVLAERGAGSTLLLRLAAGIAPATAGRVVLDGVPHVEGEFNHPFLRRGAVAWVPEDGGLIDNLTLLENLALPLRFIAGERRERAEERAFAILSRVDLGPVAELRPPAVARRDRQLAALARSRLMGAELWLLDRPLDHLEGERLACACALLAEALADPATTLVLVGDGAEERRLAPAAARLADGKMHSEEAA